MIKGPRPHGRRPIGHRRAMVFFVLGYVVVTILAFWLYLLIVAIKGGHIASPTAISRDPIYLLSEKWYPVLNLLVWTAGSWFYFRRQPRGSNQAKDALHLGTFWLILALPLDLAVWVLIPSPLSLSASSFYLGQFPWIYLTYAAVFASPLVYVATARLRQGQPQQGQVSQTQ